MKDSGIVHETKLELIKKDVDGALAIARQFDRDLARLRVGPDGLWTRLVEKHVFVLADWNGARDAFRATLWKTVQDSVKAENPMPKEMDESTWLTMVNSLTDSIIKKPNYQVLVSQFNTLGRFFQKDGPGRDRLIAILKGEAKDESADASGEQRIRIVTPKQGRLPACLVPRPKCHHKKLSRTLHKYRSKSENRPCELVSNTSTSFRQRRNS